MIGLGTKILLWSFPLLITLAVLEATLFRRLGKGSYAWRESLASVAIAVGYFFSGLLTAGYGAGIVLGAWHQRVMTIPVDTWWGIALLFLGVEFCYYWQHRCMHEVRWFWASHAVHHSPQHLNLSTAYRLPWTTKLGGAFLFYVPLSWLGFRPEAVFAMVSVDLLYQFWLHTELVPKLGWFEKIFNTPSHHRVHHAANPDYLDRNYGGVLILFDKMFGTFAEERASEPCRYGLVKQLDSNNPIVIAFHEWRAMLSDVVRAKSWHARLGHAFNKPGWQPDGKSMTSDDLRRAQRTSMQGELQ